MSENKAPGLAEHVATVWRDEIVPTLHDYIAIPNVSVAYDPDWKANGHMDRAVDLLHGWAQRRQIAGMRIEVRQIDGRTPLILIEIPAANGGPVGDTVVLYGHLDKQPEMIGWRDDLGPWKPVVEGDKMYGRGGADDGYALFASLTAIEAAHLAGYPTARCVLLIEASEESGSPDLPAHLEAIGDRLGMPSLVICLDSGAMDYERMWITTSLRGMASGVLRVDVLTEGVHSGEASGVVPSSFRVARQLLDRIEDSATGRILLDEFHVQIPADRVAEANDTAAAFDAHDVYPWVAGVRPMVDDPAEQLLARTWRPTLSITGVGGIPP
ncbi:MAG TPA: M20/M25/M40 family metallo-hydrolase, partial [Ilumatobacteraceae bacterium]|nr:M20/M25/M40 family metallo-hydrolase [Ilumatobacteraceae bacterium]